MNLVIVEVEKSIKNVSIDSIFNEVNKVDDLQTKNMILDLNGKIISELSITLGAAFTKTRILEDPGYPVNNQLLLGKEL